MHFMEAATGTAAVMLHFMHFEHILLIRTQNLQKVGTGLEHQLIHAIAMHFMEAATGTAAVMLHFMHFEHILLIRTQNLQKVGTG